MSQSNRQNQFLMSPRHIFPQFDLQSLPFSEYTKSRKLSFCLQYNTDLNFEQTLRQSQEVQQRLNDIMQGKKLAKPSINKYFKASPSRPSPPAKRRMEQQIQKDNLAMLHRL